MLRRRGLRGLIALLGASLPVAIAWLLIVLIMGLRDSAARAVGTPNPAKVAAHKLGLFDVVVYADPYLAGIINLWLLPGVAVLVGLVLWAMGILAPIKQRFTGMASPGLLTLTLTSVVVGVLLAAPWLYALVRISLSWLH
jgi:hypothetical protein